MGSVVIDTTGATTRWVLRDVSGILQSSLQSTGTTTLALSCSLSSVMVSTPSLRFAFTALLSTGLGSQTVRVNVEFSNAERSTDIFRESSAFEIAVDVVSKNRYEFPYSSKLGNKRCSPFASFAGSTSVR